MLRVCRTKRPRHVRARTPASLTFPRKTPSSGPHGSRCGAGGNGANSLEVLQQLVGPAEGVGLHLVSTLPGRSAAATRSILESFGGGCAVDFEHCLYRESHDQAASSYIMRSAATGSRTIVSYSDLPEMTADEFGGVVAAFSSPGAETWWHFEARPRPTRPLSIC